MKIAFLSFYSGEVCRGVETHVHELANRLVDFGNDVTVYQNGSLLFDSKYKTVSVGLSLNKEKRNWHFPYTNYYSLRVKTFTKKVLKLLDKDTDIVIATNGQWQSLLCRIWTLLRGKKLVISGHSGLGLDDRLNLWTFPSVFIALTNRQKIWARKVNPLVKVQKIPNGVDLSKFTSKVKGFEIDLPHPIILCVAAFDFWKRLSLTIKAVSKLKNGSLFLVGTGEEEERLRKMGEKLLPGRFRIASFKHSEMPKVYTACDLFTYPTSPWESFGIVVIEAMACGLPVVVNNDPIRREIVGDAGILVDPADTEAYVKAIKEALAKKWDDKPRKWVEKFDWAIIAGKYQKIFDEL